MIVRSLILFVLLLLSIKSFSQLSLPKVSTTKTKAVEDLSNGITNESWYESKDDNGFITYEKLFKGTPVGVRHALSEYEELIKEYNCKNCIDKSLYSSLIMDGKGSIDFEMLSISLKNESSEILKFCQINDNVLTKIVLSSLATSNTTFMIMYLYTKKTK